MVDSIRKYVFHVIYCRDRRPRLSVLYNIKYLLFRTVEDACPYEYSIKVIKKMTAQNGEIIWFLIELN